MRTLERGKVVKYSCDICKEDLWGVRQVRAGGPQKQAGMVDDGSFTKVTMRGDGVVRMWELCKGCTFKLVDLMGNGRNVDVGK